MCSHFLSAVHESPDPSPHEVLFEKGWLPCSLIYITCQFRILNQPVTPCSSKHHGQNTVQSSNYIQYKCLVYSINCPPPLLRTWFILFMLIFLPHYNFFKFLKLSSHSYTVCKILNIFGPHFSREKDWTTFSSKTHPPLCTHVIPCSYLWEPCHQL